MSTFRKYGGTQNYSKDNNITTNTLVCNNLVLRNNYVGTFTIDGGLEVSADSHFGQNVDISGNLTAQNVQINSGFVFSDLSINGNLSCGGSTYNTDLFVSGTSTLEGEAEYMSQVYGRPPLGIQSIYLLKVSWTEAEEV
jgi:hypothetical protein